MMAPTPSTCKSVQLIDEIEQFIDQLVSCTGVIEIVVADGASQHPEGIAEIGKAAGKVFVVRKFLLPKLGRPRCYFASDFRLERLDSCSRKLTAGPGQPD